jgi:hypothetical protein
LFGAPSRADRGLRPLSLRLGVNDCIYLIEANPNPWLDPVA